MPFLSYLQLGSSCTGFPSTFNVLSLLQPCSPGTRLSVSEGNKLWNGHNASTLDKNSNLQHCCRCLSSSCSLQGEGRSRGRGRQSEICHAFIRSFVRSCVCSFLRSVVHSFVLSFVTAGKAQLQVSLPDIRLFLMSRLSNMIKLSSGANWKMLQRDTFVSYLYDN